MKSRMGWGFWEELESDALCVARELGFAHGVGKWLGDNGTQYLGRMVHGSREAPDAVCVVGDVYYRGAFVRDEMHGRFKVSLTLDMQAHCFLEFVNGLVPRSDWRAAVLTLVHA